MGHGLQTIEKALTGIQGFDEITDGGLPRGRTTLVCGGPGCGKTLFATEFLVRGATQYNEPGVFIAFEETEEDLAKNAASLGFDLKELIEQKKLFVDFVFIERSEIEETGEYNLEGLFIRLAAAIAEVGAKRVVLDTIETIFSGFSNEAILRSEIRRLFRWMKDKGVTAVVTGERGSNSLTRFGLEEYVSDCVILLDNRVINKISNRILRVVKYRGTSHGTDEYPFMISDQGLWVQPITSLRLNFDVSSEFISSGVPGLDQMLNGHGFFRGSTVLVSGAAGTGKTSLAASLVDAACRRGERCLFFAFEEAEQQILRNMRSIGIDLKPCVDQGLLQIHATRPSYHSLEMHLLLIEKMVQEFKPSVVVIEPLTNLISIGSDSEVKSMLVRLIDFLKIHQVTSMFTSLTSGGKDEVTSEVGVSSLTDTWLLVRNIESNGERNRALYVLKSRGMAHSLQIREFRLTDQGIRLVDIVVGPDGIVIGSARVAQQIREESAEQRYRADIERKQRELERKRKMIENQIALLQSEIERDEEELDQELAHEDHYQQMMGDDAKNILKSRLDYGSNQQKEG